MSIRSGKIIHDAAEWVIDRMQSARPADLNIPPEKIYELSGFASVATVQDVPEVKFDLWDLRLPRNYIPVST